MEKLPLLILHGALGSKAQFTSIASSLEDEYDVHLLNFSGHGGNIIKKEFSIDLFTEDVLQYLSDNNLEQVNIFGYSMGGYVALDLARKYPKKVSKIFTLGTKFNWTPETAANEIKFLDPEKIELKIPAFAKALQQRHSPEDWKKNLKFTAALMTNLGSGTAMKPDDLTKIPHQVIIGIGALDNMVTLEESRLFAEVIPNGKLMILQDFKHPIEQIEIKTLVDKIRSFLK